MKSRLELLFKDAIVQAVERGIFDIETDCIDIGLERPKDRTNGDFASTLALRLAKQAHMTPRDIASGIVECFPKNNIVESIEIAGPGFINVVLSNFAKCQIINVVRHSGYDFAKGCGKSNDPQGTKKCVNLEYISANPTGPMHVGHGRWAALGDAIARVMTHAGYNVYQEFYVNDHGVQMNLFANSIYVRYLQLCGKAAELDDDSYGGDYIVDIARQIKETDGDIWVDKPKDDSLCHFKQVGYDAMMSELKNTLKCFGNEFDLFFSESSLYCSDDDGKNAVDRAMKALDTKGLIYSRDGATWFKTTEYGDDKDRVLIKENGEMTYFMSDIAYHYNKLNRGFDLLIDIWGADHHGYIPRCKAMMQSFGQEADTLEVLLGQLVNLFRDGKPVRMSKRTGTMITFQELIDEVGVDATRYLMLSRNSDQQIDFDIEVAKKQDSSNPVYYVQYAHARICSILRKCYLDLGANGTSTTAFGSGGFSAQGADEAKVSVMPIDDIAAALVADPDLSKLKDDTELELCRLMEKFPDLLAEAAYQRAPHKLVHYSRELASAFHHFYTNCRVMDNNKKVRKARIALCDASRIVLALTLNLLGVEAPTRM